MMTTGHSYPACSAQHFGAKRLGRMIFCFISGGSRAVDVLSGDSSGSGGAESQIAYMAEDFAGRGIRVSLIYGNGLGQHPDRTIAGVKCIDAFPNWRRPSSLLRFLKALLKSQADYFYARLPDDFLFLVVIARLLRPGSRFIYALANDAHTNPWRTFSYRPWLHNPLYAMVLFGADAVTLQHEGQRRLVQPYVRAGLAVVPNLLRLTDAEPRPFDEALIDVTWIALIRPQKQLSILLDLAESLGHLKFAIIGSFDAATLDNATSLNLQKRIQAIPNVAYYGAMRHGEVVTMLRQSKMLANTSRFEGFPNTMLESWATGVPVVSLSIDPGGVICREGLGLVSGSVTQMRHDILRLVGERDLNGTLGRQALAYVRRQHSLSAVCAALEPVCPGIAPCCSAFKAT
jgi:glycosyltransferase involved in cell wall biosynthesis